MIQEQIGTDARSAIGESRQLPRDLEESGDREPEGGSMSAGGEEEERKRVPA